MDKLTGHGRPPKSLAGKVGQHYEDLDTGDVYECRIANKYSTMHGWPVGGYIWELRAKGEDIQEFYGAGSDEAPNVKTVNGIAPDENGNVDATTIGYSEYYTLKIGRPKYTGCGYAIVDENGRVYSELYHSALEINEYVGDNTVGANISPDECRVGQSVYDGKYFKASAGVGSSGSARMTVSNSSSESVSIYADGYVSVATHLLKFGTNALPTILRFIKAPEQATDAANKAYVDAKVSDTAIIINSSTEGSTKKFKITVDDSGTITATEVTE